MDGQANRVDAGSAAHCVAAVHGDGVWEVAQNKSGDRGVGAADWEDAGCAGDEGVELRESGSGAWEDQTKRVARREQCRSGVVGGVRGEFGGGGGGGGGGVCAVLAGGGGEGGGGGSDSAGGDGRAEGGA